MLVTRWGAYHTIGSRAALRLVQIELSVVSKTSVIDSY